jgi:hypothetical protein
VDLFEQSNKSIVMDLLLFFVQGLCLTKLFEHVIHPGYREFWMHRLLLLAVRIELLDEFADACLQCVVTQNYSLSLFYYSLFYYLAESLFSCTGRGTRSTPAHFFIHRHTVWWVEGLFEVLLQGMLGLG